jgi:molecular chaperone DnaJ
LTKMAAQKKKDYYGILGISYEADRENLKKAYRELAKKYHPDRQPEDARAEEYFKEIQEAYCVLKDPIKRDQYDAEFLGRKEPRGGKRGKSAGRPARGKGQGASDVVGDVFEFLRNRMEDRGKRGEDLRYLVALTFKEAALGVEKVIRIPKRKDCTVCAGRGWRSPARSLACQVCRGEGEVTVRKGNKRVVRECPGCKGKGILEKQACEKCKGKGKIHYQVQRRITIPAGVDNGSRLKVRGEGGKGERGGEDGDLYVVIQVQDHPVFTRRNLDICCEITVHFTQAVLGDEISVPTLKGMKPLRIPPGTQNGTVFTLEGCGVPCLDGSRRGDQQVRLQVEVPRRVSPEEEELLKAWQGLRQDLA